MHHCIPYIKIIVDNITKLGLFVYTPTSKHSIAPTFGEVTAIVYELSTSSVDFNLLHHPIPRKVIIASTAKSYPVEFLHTQSSPSIIGYILRPPIKIYILPRSRHVVPLGMTILVPPDIYIVTLPYSLTSQCLIM